MPSFSSRDDAEMQPIIGGQSSSSSSLMSHHGRHNSQEYWHTNRPTASTTAYQSFAECIQEEEESSTTNHGRHDHDQDVIVHVLSTQEESTKSYSWRNYINDLDFFFKSVYFYHRHHGFWCIIVDSLLSLFQFLFVVFFSLFLLHFIDYDLIFHRNQGKKKLSIRDVILPLDSFVMSSFEIFLLCLSSIYFAYRVIRVARAIVVNASMRSFFEQSLKIKAVDSFSWNEVMVRLLSCQRLYNHVNSERPLTQLDICNRIMRLDNYLIALMNKGLIPVNFFGGKITHLDNGFVFNLKFILKTFFFEKSFKVKSQVKVIDNRLMLSRLLWRQIVIIGIINALLSPLVFFWVILNTFFSYAEAVKRDFSGTFALRTWSVYSKIYCRHFNELDHSLDDRLDRAFKSTAKYLDSFGDPFGRIIARHVSFIASSVLAVLLGLTIYDEDLLGVEHVLTLMTSLGVVVGVARAFSSESTIPFKYSQSELFAQTLEHIHYFPSLACTSRAARADMSTLFHYRIQALVESLVSPIITPFILIFALAPKSLEIVDFFRAFTVEVDGVGDVCSFALLNVAKNGNVKYTSNAVAATSTVDQDHQTTNGGKLELSLIHFKLQNPAWNPKEEHQEKFLDFVSKNNSKVLLEEDEETREDQESSQLFLSKERSRLINQNKNIRNNEEEETSLQMTLSTLFLHELAATPASPTSTPTHH